MYIDEHNPERQEVCQAGLTGLVTDPTEQLVITLERLTPPSRFSLKAPTFNGSGDVELFIEQFEDVAEANSWLVREAFLHRELTAHMDERAPPRKSAKHSVPRIALPPHRRKSTS